MNFFIADVETAFGPFIALYLAEQGWRQSNIGAAIALNSAVALLVQIPAGMLIDQLHRKRVVIAVGLTGLASGSLLVAFFPGVLPVMLAEVLFGASGAPIRIAIAAVALGLVGHRRLHTRTGRNQRFLSLGNGLTALAMGVLGQYGSPRAPFLIAAALCVPAAIALATIRDREINYARARQSVGRKEEHAAPWHELLRNRPLRLFAFCLLLFQLADASMLPLATERLSLRHEPASELVTSGLVVVPQLVTALLAAWMAREADERGRKMLLLLAFAALSTRGVLFAIDLGSWFLVGVQVLGGLTSVVIGILTPLVVADLTRQSGRYNVSLGAVIMISGAGAVASTFTTGFIAEYFGFAPGFLALTAVAVAGMALVWLRFQETVEAARSATEEGTGSG